MLRCHRCRFRHGVTVGDEQPKPSHQPPVTSFSSKVRARHADVKCSARTTHNTVVVPMRLGQVTAAFLAGGGVHGLLKALGHFLRPGCWTATAKSGLKSRQHQPRRGQPKAETKRSGTPAQTGAPKRKQKRCNEQCRPVKGAHVKHTLRQMWRQQQRLRVRFKADVEPFVSGHDQHGKAGAEMADDCTKRQQGQVGGQTHNITLPASVV